MLMYIIGVSTFVILAIRRLIIYINENGKSK